MSSTFRCPSPYKFDETSGMCVEPTPPGYILLNGKFVRTCPTGMTMNSVGTCIRQVISRDSFINEAAIKNTIIGVVAENSGTANAIFGTYDPAAFDMTFTNNLNLNSNNVQQILANTQSETFLVGQDSLSDTINGNSIGISEISKKAQVNSKNDGLDMPTGTIKMELNSTTNEMFILGSPRTKIFTADYVPTQGTKIDQIPMTPIFHFPKEAFDESGSTDIYYGGSTNQITNIDEVLKINETGLFQSGIDDVSNPKEQQSVPPQITNGCSIYSYNRTQPANPYPRLFSFVSDGNSRNITRAEYADTSFGYIIAGRNIQDQSGSAISLRYLDNDPCILKNAQPQAQSFISLNLGFPQSNGDIRVARFDVDSNGVGPDTIYIFGNDVSATTSNLLSFTSENYNYVPNPLTYSLVVDGETLNGQFVIPGGVLSEVDYETIWKLFIQSMNRLISNFLSIDDPITFTYNATSPSYFETDVTFTLEISDTFVHSLFFLPDSEMPFILVCDPGNQYTFERFVNPSYVVYNNFSGLSTDDNISEISSNAVVNSGRSLVNCMPIGGSNNTQLRGKSISAWSYEPVNQSLLFAISNSDLGSQSSYNSGSPLLITTNTQTYQFVQDSESFTIRNLNADHIQSIEVHLWGEGGSSDPNQPGLGGAGAYVGGIIKRESWSPFINSQNGLISFDVEIGKSGGTANRNGIGAGGGFSAFRVQTGTNSYQYLAIAAGGGGSIGKAYGGPGGISEGSDGTSFNNSANFGRGGSLKSGGKGGTAFGDLKVKKSSDGRKYDGGSSTWSSKLTVGGGGGGGGFYGGGSGCYLGYTQNTLDCECGGGGGSSMTTNFSTLYTGTGTLNVPFQSTNYPTLYPTVGYGGSLSTNGKGQSGFVEVIITFRNNFGSSQSLNEDPLQLWYLPSGALKVMKPQLYGIPTKIADWSSVFQNIRLPLNLPIAALYSGSDGLIVIVFQSEGGRLYENDTCYVYWSFGGTSLIAGTDVFGPIDVATDSPAGPNTANGPSGPSGPTQIRTVPSLKNCKTIKAFNPSNGSRQLCFVGDGIRIFDSPTASTTWKRASWLVDENNQLLDNVKFSDVQYNESSSRLEASGKPSELNIQTLHQSVWTPRFANFYNANDNPDEVLPYVPWQINNANPTNLLGPVINAPNDIDVVITLDNKNYITNTLFCIVSNETEELINFYNFAQPPTGQNFTTDSYTYVITQLQHAIQNSASAIIPSYSGQVSVVLGPFNVLAITMTGLNDQVDFSLSFQNNFDITNMQTAFDKSALLLGFQSGIVIAPTISESNGQYSYSWLATSPMKPIGFVDDDNIVLYTPISVGLDENSVINGSIYDIYSPQPKLCKHNDLVVAIGGPLMNPYTYDSEKKIGQAGAGSPYHIDYITTNDGASWTLLDPQNQSVKNIKSVIQKYPIRSPANILLSNDGGSSFTYPLSLYSIQNNAENVCSETIMTGLDCLHVVKGFQGSPSTIILPAQFLRDQNSTLNAVVSQFNDVQFFDFELIKNSVKYDGFYLATGQFVWELNTLLDPLLNKTITWPKNLNDLNGVAWISLDGIVWTTIPFATDQTSDISDKFWIVYKSNYFDKIRNLGSIITDQGLYFFRVDDVMNLVYNIFHGQGYIKDFNITSRTPCIRVSSAGSAGLYGAKCLLRNAIGSCVSCEDENSWSVTIPQIVGPAGVIQPNFDACLAKPRGDLNISQTYSSIEAELDAEAIAAYSGYDTSEGPHRKSKYVQGLRQSFYDENDRRLMICPIYTQANYTPAYIDPQGSTPSLANSMQCFIDPSMNIFEDETNHSGFSLVRRPLQTPDFTDYSDYAWEARYLNFLPYDSFDANNSTKLESLTCPSTFGIGGSKIDPQELIDDMNTLTIYNDQINPQILSKVTNLGQTSGELQFEGPFYQNESINVDANWNPSSGDRAVLANKGDLLSDFGYSFKSSPPLTYGPSGSDNPNPYLYKLSSFEYPYDAISKNEDGKEVLSIGRDPQVFEPGYTNLSKLSGTSTLDPTYEIFDDQYWPANPVPQEGFGIWYIRPQTNENGQMIPQSLPGTAERTLIGMFYSQLGYGSIQIGSGTSDLQTIKSYPVNQDIPVDVPLFNYDTSNVNNVSNYMQLTQNGWANFLPYQGNDNGEVMSKNILISKSCQPDPNDLNRSKYAKLVMQNILALPLRNTKNTIQNSLTNNYVKLVSRNFYRPRNWTFANLSGTENNFCGEQPNLNGQYEFFFPDPYFNSQEQKALQNIIGFNNLQGPNVSNNDSHLRELAASLVYPLNTLGTPSIPMCIDVYLKYYLVPYKRAFHYWTFVQSTQTSDVDIFLRLDYKQTVAQAVTAFQDKTSLQSIQNFILESQQFQDIKTFCTNPLNSFMWIDPIAQTTRPLSDILGTRQSQVASTNVNVSLCLVLSIEPRTNLTKPITSCNQVSLWIKFSYKNLVIGPYQDKDVDILGSNNTNSINYPFVDSTSKTAGFVPQIDPRGYDIASNMPQTDNQNLMNVTQSDYNVEIDNYSKINQDLLAQSHQCPEGSTKPFGDPVYGFGLRIDKNCVVTSKLQQPSFISQDGTPTSAKPNHHGYVSFVRTIVDSQNRFTPGGSIDKSPHYHKLQYITRYVPSTLQNYGVKIPMKMMTQISVKQCILSPLKLENAFFVRNVPIVHWFRPNSYLSYQGSYIAVSSEHFDVEAPGYYGRQPLTIDSNQTFFTTDGTSYTPKYESLYKLASPATQTPNIENPPLSGYDGFYNGTIQIDSGSSFGNQSLFFRQLPLSDLNALGIGLSSPGPDKLLSNSTGKSAGGQMLFKLTDLDSPNSTGTYASANWAPIRLMVQVSQKSAYYLTLDWTKFFTVFWATYDASFSNQSFLVTAAEFADLFYSALTDYCNDPSSAGAAFISYFDNTGSNKNIEFSSEFNAVSDRSKVTVKVFSNVLVNFRIFVPSPISNWLGLVGVCLPNLNVVRNSAQDTTSGLFYYKIYDSPINSPNGITSACQTSVNSTQSVYTVYNSNTINNNWFGNTLRITQNDAMTIIFRMNYNFSTNCILGQDLTDRTQDGQFGLQIRNDNNVSTIEVGFKTQNKDYYQSNPSWAIFLTVKGNDRAYTPILASGQAATINLFSEKNVLYPQPTWKNNTWMSGSTDWTQSGWPDTSSDIPTYSLVYEGYTPTNSITFVGTQNLTPDIKNCISPTGPGPNYFCNIQNVSWTARLLALAKTANSTPSQAFYFKHFWGFADESYKDIQKNGETLSLYHLDGDHGYDTNLAQKQLQNAPNLFSDFNGSSSIIPGFGRINYADPTQNIQIPCDYGNQGIGSFGQIQKPTYFLSTADNSGNYNATSGPYFSTVLTNDQVALASTNGIPNILHCQQTGPNILVTNLVSSTVRPTYTLTVPTNVNVTIGNIQNCMAMFLIQNPCFINIGAMSQNIASTKTKMALWIFNQKDVHGIIASHGAQQNISSLRFLTYMSGNPYLIDEAYDSAKYSTLGRSIFIGKSGLIINGQDYSAKSSFDQKELDLENEVFVFIAPAALSTTLNTFSPTKVNCLDTYSTCTPEYKIFNPYDNGSSTIYNVSFTSPEEGPALTFYGLSNNESVLSGQDLTSAPNRKTFSDFDGNQNDQLGKDIRQVYIPLPNSNFNSNFKAPRSASLSTSSSLSSNDSVVSSTIDNDPTLGNSNNVSWKNTPASPIPLPRLVTSGLSSITKTWSQIFDVNTSPVYFLPLAGTWIGDGAVNKPRFQMIPNYEGLSLNAEWSNLYNYGIEKLPLFKMYAVDRSFNANQSLNIGDHPFNLSTLNLMKPQSLFVMICDMWRNTIRGLVNPLRTANGSNILFSNKSTMPVISTVDCMGPSNYNNGLAFNKTYFDYCELSRPVTPFMGVDQINGQPWPTEGKIATPWIIQNDGSEKIWNVFTGGLSWNSFLTKTDVPALASDYRFPPSLWYPTYQWQLSRTDPFNVSITSIASNVTLLNAGFCVVSCSDGTIRKIDLNKSSYPAVETTGTQTFLNGSINLPGARSSVNYVAPGRLYNLTYWNNHWWCTADNHSVWTTAPVVFDDGTQEQINQTVTLASFNCSLIQFRPLSIREGHPSSWANANWPQNEAHKFNLMKIVSYGSNENLFVGSTDGEYIVITGDANNFIKSIRPHNLDSPNIFDKNSYVTDITVVDDSLVVGSLPLQMNPRYDSPIREVLCDSLAYTIKSDIENGPSNFTNGLWTSMLTDANVITTNISLDPNEFLISDDVYNNFSKYIATIDLDGQKLIKPIWSKSGLSNVVLSHGLYKLYASGNDEEPFAGLCDISLPSMPNYNLSKLNAEINGLYSLTPTFGSVPGGIHFIVSHNEADMSFQDPNEKGQYQPNIFLRTGLNMDFLTKAFFVVDSAGNTGKIFQTAINQDLGLKIPIKQYLRFNGIGPANDPQKRFTYASSKHVPMWTQSIIWTTTTSSTNSYLANIPQHKGPLANILPDLNDKSLDIYQTMNIRRTIPLLSNLIISDIAVAQEVTSIAWTTFGPFGSEGPKLGQITNGTIRQIPMNPNFVYDPRFVSQSIIAWNPYEVKWYAAGYGNHIPDFDQVEDRSSLRPRGISEENWALAMMLRPGSKASSTRLLLLSADASYGTTENGMAIPFQQVYRTDSRINNVYTLSPVSLWFQEISCFGFSPNATVIGGLTLDPNSSVMHGPAQAQYATIAWRINISAAGNDLLANWNFLNLGVFGTVTAIKFVGYAWYISTWDPYSSQDKFGNYQGQSSMFFASLNFNAVSSLDGWNSNNNSLLRVKSIDAIVPTYSVCAPGFEPSPSNPTACVKKCPSGFKPFGIQCVQICPQGFTETSVPNECQPNSRNAKFVSATQNGVAPVTNAPFRSAGHGTTTNSAGTFGTTEFPVNTLVFSMFAILVMIFVMGIAFYIYKKFY